MAVPKERIDERMKRFEAVLRAHGLKVTHQRTEVFRVLARTDEHPDAETIYQRVRKRVSAISLDTVYRTLAALEDLGLVRKAEAASGAARYDANTDHHHHFICTCCGLVRDVISPDLDHLRIPESVRKLGQVTSSHVQLRGMCEACMGEGCA